MNSRARFQNEQARICSHIHPKPFFSENWNAFVHVLPKIKEASWWNHYMWADKEASFVKWQLNLNLLFHSLQRWFGYLTVFRYVWILFLRPNFVHLICVSISLPWFLSIGVFQYFTRKRNDRRRTWKMTRRVV